MTGDFVDPSRVHASMLSRLPGVNGYFRYLAPLYPGVFERFDLSGYDTVVSSTSSWAKGVRVASEAIHVCYLHTVSRFVFDYDGYVGARWARPIVSRLIDWDLAAARLPHRFIVNSHNVAKRVQRYYGRDAIVLPGPVDTDRIAPGCGGGEYFLVVSRLLPYKRIDVAIEAAQMARVPLVVAGTGPAEGRLRALARGTTTTMTGFVSDERVYELMRHARAVIFPGEEDFGLVPIEAAAAGRPTIAFRAGGALETVIEGQTGTFFESQTPQSLAQVLRTFDESAYDPRRMRSHAQGYSVQAFVTRLHEIVDQTRRAFA